jgi:hypothetical protein
MYTKNEPVPMMRNGTVADRIKLLERTEKSVLNTLRQRRTSFDLSRPTIQVVRCVLVGAGV